MKQAIQLLQVEDSEDDALLIVHLLQKSGYEVVARRVETEQEMRAAVENGSWSLVIADFRLPQFSAPDALAILQQTGLDIPFLVVSGAIGEDVAVSLMKAGAHDYILKDNLDRLAPAVERELHEAAMRSEKRDAETNLRSLHCELEAIYSNAPVLLFVTGENLRVEKVNERGARFSGRKASDCIGKCLCSLIDCRGEAHTASSHSEEQPCACCPLWNAAQDALAHDLSRDGFEISAVRKDVPEPKPSYFLVSIAPQVAGEKRKALICMQDVTRRKQAELALQESVDSLESALAQNTVLFQEVHHRVKNNLQIVASLLSMKARKGKENICAEDLRDCERRIRTMAMIHEQLYSQKDMSMVDFSEYVRKIASDLVSSFEGGGAIRLVLDLRPATLSIDQSIPCGLILNELITNALKYAYPERKGEIAVSLATEGETVWMTVADGGVGMPAGSTAGCNSLGMQIIRMLAKQLKGAVEFSGPPGTTASLAFLKTH